MTATAPAQTTAAIPVAAPTIGIDRPRPRLITASRLLLATALLVFLVTVPSLASAPTTTYGLLFAGVPGLAASVVLAALAFAVAVRNGSVGDAAAAVAGYLLCFRLPVALGTDLPIGAWTFKHFGVIDYITSRGALPSGADVYGAWPGGFTAVAWFSEATGVDPLDIGRWFPVGVHVAIAVGVFAICRASGLPALVALCGVFIAETVNWVGQDYISPQAIAYFLALGILVLLLRSRTHPAVGWLTVPLFAAVTVTHQLTPYWLVGIALVLGLSRQIRPRAVGLVYLAIAVGYLALNYGALSAYSLFSGFDPVRNSHVNANGSGSDGLAFTGVAIKLTVAALWGGAALVVALALWRARRRGQSLWRSRGAWRIPALPAPVWVSAVLAFSPFALLGMQNYGGEAILRVFLFSIPGCAVLLAPVVHRALSVAPRLGEALAPRLLSFAGATVLLVAVSLSSLQAYYGGWFTLVVAKDALAAAEGLLRTQTVPTRLLSPAPVSPNRAVGEYVAFARDNRTFDESLSVRPDWPGQDFRSTATTSALTSDLQAAKTPAFLLVTTQMQRYSDYYGLYPAGALDRLTAQLEANPNWLTVIDTPSVHLFELRRSE